MKQINKFQTCVSIIISYALRASVTLVRVLWLMNTIVQLQSDFATLSIANVSAFILELLQAFLHIFPSRFASSKARGTLDA